MSTTKKYELVYQQIINEISTKPFDKLPTEKQLALQYEVSTHTIRKALSYLKNNGYIVSRQGSGYYPVPHKNNFENKRNMIMNSFAPWKHQNDIESKVISFELNRPSDFECEMLAISPEELIYRIKRLRIIDNTPMLLENTIIPYRLVPHLRKEDLSKSLHSYIENVTQCKIKYANKEVQAATVNSSDAKLLNLNPDSPVLVVRHWAYLENGIQFEYSVNVYVDEKLYFTVQNNKFPN